LDPTWIRHGEQINAGRGPTVTFPLVRGLVCNPRGATISRARYFR
jgi:hypothetical protein